MCTHLFVFLRFFLLFFLFLLYTAAQGDTAPAGVLETPSHGQVVTGVSPLSGWACHTDLASIRINESTTGFPVVVKGTRVDAASVCGHTDSGFAVLFNWNLLNEGKHTVALFVDDQLVSSSVITVVHYGSIFRTGLTGQWMLEGWPEPDMDTTVAWDESTQNIRIVNIHKDGHSVTEEEEEREEEGEKKGDDGKGGDGTVEEETLASLLIGTWHLTPILWDESDILPPGGATSFTFDQLFGSGVDEGARGRTDQGYPIQATALSPEEYPRLDYDVRWSDGNTCHWYGIRLTGEWIIDGHYSFGMEGDYFWTATTPGGACGSHEGGFASFTGVRQGARHND